jgi:hypothetical protein
VSNVPGPRERRWVLGGRLVELHSLAEVGERHGLRLSALSYAGTVSIGLCADAHAIPDVGTLGAALDSAFDDLHAAIA